MSTSNYTQWIDKLEHILIEKRKLPIVEESFPFPWEEASRKISECLNLKDLKLIAQSSEWKSHDTILSGIGGHPSVIRFEFSPIGHSVFWVIPQDSVSDLTSSTISLNEQKEKFSDSRLQEGYYHFIMLEVLDVIKSLKVFRDLTPHMTFSSSLPQEECLCIDVALSFYPKTMYARVIIPKSFLQAFKTHQPLQKQSLLSRDHIKHLEFTLRLETGSVMLHPDDWRGVAPGDFIILDKCSYDPKEQKGSILMYLEGVPILQARIKPEGIKVLDYIFYKEEAEEPLILEKLPAASHIEESLNKEGLIEDHKEDDRWIQAPQEEALTHQEIAHTPIKIDIEADHIRMPLHKILEMKPDQLLDVVVRPELGVNLLIQNEHVGKAELIKLGETIGVRVCHKHG